jgi:ABC-2 type transport system permease protein
MAQKVNRVTQFKISMGLTKYALKSSLRNKVSYFFSLIFPLIFVSIFGLIGNSSSPLKLGVDSAINKANPIYQTLKSIANQPNAGIQLSQDNHTNLVNSLNKSDISAFLETDPAHPNNLTVVGSNNNPQGKATAETVLSGVISQMNLQAAGVTVGKFQLQNQEITGKPYSYIDFALPGQIGFSLLSIATFGIAFPLITLRQTLVLKRMFATAAEPISFVISQCLSRSLQAMVQAAVILGVGIFAFHFTLAHGWISALDMFILAFIGVLTFLGFGILIGNLARDEQSLPIAINLFNLPQILLAGVFFPIDGLPHWVQAIGNNLPLAYLNTAMRQVANDGASLTQVWPYILGMLAWGAFSYILAARFFKSE